MCYSARVEQNFKELKRLYGAEVDFEAFAHLFHQRLQTKSIKISRNMEANFLASAPSPAKSIAQDIVKFRELELTELETEIFKQKKRRVTAEQKHQTHPTKKTTEDIRISGDKIELLLEKIKRLKQPPTKSDSRIFPGNYAPLMVWANNQIQIRPYRYLLRPFGQPSTFDRKYSGCYNARKDRLTTSAFWKNIYGKQHGVIAIDCFWENVKLHNYEQRSLRSGETEKNLVIKFEPKDPQPMLVPCLFDQNVSEGYTLLSFAMITDEPNPEVAAAGHDRTPVTIQHKNLGGWLQPNQPISTYHQILGDKPTWFFEHQVAA